ncbi:rhomboid family intramembrane serine protease [Peribacillus asahii]|uniref:rhomboid family intramembrane serine protease n=1 Tax=Peribacillus asahii TaxID=228899 RepID=UPI0037F73D93
MFIRTESFQQYVRCFPAVTSYIFFMMIVFVLTLFPSSLGNIIHHGTGVNLYIADGQWWRLLTPTFLHYSFTHILFNGFSLAIFGPALEKILGSIKFALFFLLTGIIANIATFFLTPLTFIHTGASGAIFGILGFFLYMARFRKHHLSKNEIHTIYTLTGIAVIMTFIQPNINIVAHIGGLLAGVILAPLFWRK